MKDGNKYEYESIGAEGQPVDKVAVLDENDKTFMKIRHNHITDCVKFLRTNVDTFALESKAKP